MKRWKHWTPYELTILRAAYREKSGVDLPVVSKTIGRSEAAIACKAEELGFTSRRGKQKRTKRHLIGARASHHRIWSRLQHPRGMSGKKHSPQARAKMSKTRAGYYRGSRKTEPIGETPPA